MKINGVFYHRYVFVAALFFIFSLTAILPSHSQDLGRGFYDHGPACSIASTKGIVATVDGNGRNVALAWLMDHRGVYALLMIDAETGKSRQLSMPFVPKGKTSIFSSMLSRENKFYTYVTNNFVEFDPVKGKFTFSTEAPAEMAMGMTEDDNGLIWAVTYPNSGVVSFNPKTREFKDYGYLYKQNWKQYPKFLATDDKGYVYFGLGNTFTQIIAFNPATGKATPMLQEPERKKGIAYVYRDLNGKVYGQSVPGDNEEWYEFYEGKGHKIGKHHISNPKPIISGNQELFYGVFPDGKKIKKPDLLAKTLFIEDPKTGTNKELSFDYTNDGAWVLGVGASPDGKIVGGSSFPMRFFSFNPKTNLWTNERAFGQSNTLATQDKKVYIGVYPSGSLLEWDTSKPWVNTQQGTQSNPQYLSSSVLITHRPLRVLPYPDKKTVIMSGKPEYGYTGGGLLFWDREKKSSVVIPDSAIILDQSTMSMVPLPGGKFLGGTTVEPGTGGEKKAREAELYIMDISSKKIEWHNVILPGVQEYSDMCLGPNGLIYGITDFRKFFVFDPVKKKIVYQQGEEVIFGRTAGSQSPRIFVKGSNSEIFILYEKGIAKVDPKTFEISMVKESPVPINVGGDYLDGKIYFISGSHLCSYKLPDSFKK